MGGVGGASGLALVSANRAAIDRLRGRLAAVSDVLLEKIREYIGAELQATIQRSFAAGTNPDGQPWQPRRKRSGGGLALVTVAPTVMVETSREGVLVTIGHPRARFHQGGWRVKSGKRTVARLMIPGRRRVGAEWLKAIRRGADRALREAKRAGTR